MHDCRAVEVYIFIMGEGVILVLLSGMGWNVWFLSPAGSCRPGCWENGASPLPSPGKSWELWTPGPFLPAIEPH